MIGRATLPELRFHQFKIIQRPARHFQRANETIRSTNISFSEFSPSLNLFNEVAKHDISTKSAGRAISRSCKYASKELRTRFAMFFLRARVRKLGN
jgi:hypothetical protein